MDCKAGLRHNAYEQWEWGRPVDVVVALKSFLRVAETGSFSLAAADLGLTQPAVSRQVAGLEDHFAVRLFHRSTSGLSLTAEGERTLALAHRVLEAVDDLGDALRPGSVGASGQVRLSVPAPLGLYLAERVGGLFARHPGLRLDLILREQPSDLIAEGIDIEVRLGVSADSSLVSRRLGLTTAFLVASPAYLGDRGGPARPAEIADYDTLCYNRAGHSTEWIFSDGSDYQSVSLRPRLVANNAVAVHRAALAGVGLAVLSHLFAGPDLARGALVALMPDYPPARVPIFAVYPTRRNLPERVRAVLDFLVEAVAEDAAMR